ncbi:MAG: 3-oxoacyl-[acyl-carrier-protein] synthase III C-terminal domain-containing protein [Methanocellales archaeon]
MAIAVPPYEYTTEEMLEIFPGKMSEEARRTILNLGVEKRHLCFDLKSISYDKTLVKPHVSTSQVCVEAGKRCLEKAGVKPERISRFIAIYDYHERLCPGPSGEILRKIGLSPYTKDLNIQGMACSSFPRAVELIENTLKPREYLLLVISGCISPWFINQAKHLNNIFGPMEIKNISSEERRKIEFNKWRHLTEFFLFGDGAIAILAGGEECVFDLKILKTASLINLAVDDFEIAYLELNEGNFYSYIDRRLRALIIEYMKKIVEQLAIDFNEIKKWAIHIGSKRIVDEVSRYFNIDFEKARESYEVLSQYGNMSGASVPFILYKIFNNNSLQSGDKGGILDFGWGFRADAIIYQLNYL